MYSIEQVEGELVEASKKLRQAVKVNDMETAEKIYRQYVNSEPSYPISRDNVWWIYNAPHRIKTQSSLTVEDYGKFHGNDEQRSYQAARAAERKVGGKWNVYYEY